MSILLLSALYATAGLTCLLYKRIKLFCCVSIWICYFIMLVFLEPLLSTWIFIPALAAAELIVYFCSRRNFFNVILSLTGYIFAMLIQYLVTMHLSFQGIRPAAAASHAVLLLMSLFTCLILYLLHKYFFSLRLPVFESCPVFLQRVFFLELLLGAGIMNLSFVYGKSVKYPTEFPVMNMLLTSGFTLATTAVFYGIYGILQRNLALQKEKEQMAVMREYTSRLEKFCEEMRVLRHDYRNILATLQDYIDSTDCIELQQYFHKTLLPGFSALSGDGIILGKLRLIEEPALKSLLCAKLSSALDRKLNLSLELTETVPQTALNTLDLCRILGILLDNAIEAAAEADSRRLHVAIISLDREVVFLVRNSTLPLQAPISQLSSKGYTTKDGHTGLGLATLTEILSPLSTAVLSTDYSGEEFTQTLTIQVLS